LIPKEETQYHGKTIKLTFAMQFEAGVEEEFAKSAI
jgi:hypothetical protein